MACSAPGVWCALLSGPVLPCLLTAFSPSFYSCCSNESTGQCCDMGGRRCTLKLTCHAVQKTEFSDPATWNSRLRWAVYKFVPFMSCVPRHHAQEAPVLTQFCYAQSLGELMLGTARSKAKCNELPLLTAAMLGNAGTGKPSTQNRYECSITFTWSVIADSNLGKG